MIDKRKGYKIKLNSTESVVNFVNMCSNFSCDINVYDGSKIIDAKSILGILGISKGKEVLVIPITDDQNTVINFKNNIKNYQI